MIYDPRVGINIISKSLVIDYFLEESFSFSQKRLKWFTGKILETEGILRVINTKIGEWGIFLDFYIFDIPQDDPPFILIGRPIERFINSVFAQGEDHLYRLDV